MRRYDKAGWLLAGAALVLLLIPSGALSAVTTSFVTLTDKGGTHFARVDKAQQVLASEADTTQVLAIYGFAEPVNCFSLYTVPAGKALVVKTVNWYPFMGSETSQEVDVTLDSASCNGSPVTQGEFTGGDGQFQMQTLDLGPGAIVPSGSVLYTESYSPDDGASTSFVMRGYLIPAGAAPPARQLAIESPAVRKALASQHARQTP